MPIYQPACRASVIARCAKFQRGPGFTLLRREAVGLSRGHRRSRGSPTLNLRVTSRSARGTPLVHFAPLAAIYKWSNFVRSSHRPPTKTARTSSGVPNIDKGIGVEQHEIRSLSSFDGTEPVRLSIKGRNSACGDPQEIPLSPVAPRLQLRRLTESTPNRQWNCQRGRTCSEGGVQRGGFGGPRPINEF